MLPCFFKKAQKLRQRASVAEPQDRSRLVDILLESLHEPAIAEVEAAWELEIERRLAEHDRGEANSIDGGEVFAKARSIAR